MRVPILALLLTGVTPAMAQAPAPFVPPVPQTAAAKALLAAEDRRFRAELTHDAATLDRMTASDVVYSHLPGMREDKAGVLNTFTHIPLTSITPMDRYARVLGDVGIVRGKVVRTLPDRTLTDGYLAVYVHRDGRWQLLEWVSAAPPPATKP